MTVTRTGHLFNSISSMVQHCNIELNGQRDDLCHIPCKRWKWQPFLTSKLHLFTRLYHFITKVDECNNLLAISIQFYQQLRIFRSHDFFSTLCQSPKYSVCSVSLSRVLFCHELPMVQLFLYYWRALLTIRIPVVSLMFCSV